MAEIEDLRRRLEVAETKLRLVLQGSGGQTEEEEQTDDGSGEKESAGASANHAGGERVQTSKRSGRKSHRGGEFILSRCGFCMLMFLTLSLDSKF